MKPREDETEDSFIGRCRLKQEELRAKLAKALEEKDRRMAAKRQVTSNLLEALGGKLPLGVSLEKNRTLVVHLNVETPDGVTMARKVMDVIRGGAS